MKHFRSVVRLGELDLNPIVNDGANPLDVPIEKILPHEEYNEAQLVNDIAVLKLKDTVTFNSKLPSAFSREVVHLFYQRRFVLELILAII